MRWGGDEHIRAKIVGPVDSFVVTAGIEFEDNSFDHYVWVGRLAGTVPGRDTATAQSMLADSFRRGSKLHYGGYDMIPGPGVWGATPARMMLARHREYPRVDLDQTSGHSGTDTCEVTLIALVDAEGVVRLAKSSNGNLPPELKRVAEQGVIGKRVEPLVFEGHPVGAWMGLIALLPCRK
jgi:hypothetical protein